jgi:hypothetical protein
MLERAALAVRMVRAVVAVVRQLMRLAIPEPVETGHLAS